MEGHVFLFQKTAGFTLELFGHLRVLAQFKENATGHLNGFVSFSWWQFETCCIFMIILKGGVFFLFFFLGGN